MGILMVAMVILFKETRGSVLLSRKAKKINKHLVSLDAQESTSEKAQSSTVRYSIAHLLYLSLTTPFKLLLTEPVVFFFSLWAAFAWGVLYMQLNVLPLVFSTNHNFTIEEQGAVFASLIIGVLIALTISIYQ